MLLEYGGATHDDLFNTANAAKVAGRPHSTLAAMGRWLDAEGKLPKPWLDSCKDEAPMVELWAIARAEAIMVKSNFVQWWTGKNEAQAGFLVNGGGIGLCRDFTG